MSKLSYQLYSSRNFPPLENTLRMVSETGYAQVEGYGGLFAGVDDLADLKASLDQNKLHMATSHIGLDMLENDIERVLSIARAMSLEAVYCPHVVAEARPENAAGWRAFGKRVQDAGARLREAGLTFGWHNHDFEFVPCADGSIPMAEILEGGPDLSWEADIAWIVRGGGDPLQWLRDYSGRVTAVHVKDIAPEGQKTDEDGWADVGTGVMDWPALMAAARTAGAKFFVMEHDNPSDDVRFAKTSFATVSKF